MGIGKNCHFTVTTKEQEGWNLGDPPPAYPATFVVELAIDLRWGRISAKKMLRESAFWPDSEHGERITPEVALEVDDLIGQIVRQIVNKDHGFEELLIQANDERERLERVRKEAYPEHEERHDGTEDEDQAPAPGGDSQD